MIVAATGSDDVVLTLSAILEYIEARATGARPAR